MRERVIAAAAIDEQSTVMFSIAAHLLRLISTAAAAVDEQSCVLFSIAAHLLRRRSAAAAPSRTNCHTS